MNNKILPLIKKQKTRLIQQCLNNLPLKSRVTMNCSLLWLRGT